MTTHFLVPGKEGSAVRVSRTSKNTWLVSLPLAAGLQGTLPDISASFGFPVKFTCSCLSMNSCVCSHESIYKFWRAVADFLSYISDFGRTNTLLLESVRKRFIKFYVDLPVLQLSKGNDDQSPGDIRDSLIREANGLLSSSPDHSYVPRWDTWPSDSVSLDDEVYSVLFARDIQALSQIKIATDRKVQDRDLPGTGLQHFNDLVGSTWSSLTEILQVASVLDQINLVDISSHMLAYVEDSVTQRSGNPPLDQSFFLRINSTLSDRNSMKWVFLPNEWLETNQRPDTSSSSQQNLDKFRTKLSKLLQFKQRARQGERKYYSPIFASDSEEVDDHIKEDPVGTYLEAKRHETRLIADTNNSEDEFELVAEFHGPDYVPPPPNKGLPKSYAWGYPQTADDVASPTPRRYN